MIKGCRLPRCRVVAGLASLREAASHMAWVRGVLEILQVTRNASCVRQVVVVVDMAVGALARRHRMPSRQREAGSAVVKRRTGPGAGGVALRTSLRKIRAHVIRIGGALEILQVTRNASRVRQVVVVVDMAVGALAWRHRVPSRQREASGAVVKRRIGPGTRAVALGTGLRKIRAHVIRIGGALEILQVTRNARRVGQVVVVVDVAVRALPRRHRVSTGQWESRRSVIEFRIQPVVSAMATLARGGELGGDVIRVCGRLKILEVA